MGTHLTLQLVNRSIMHPRGIIVDIFVKVVRFILLVNYVILDKDEDAEWYVLESAYFTYHLHYS